jgi:hypothetical protein
VQLVSSASQRIEHGVELNPREAEYDVEAERN